MQIYRIFIFFFIIIFFISCSKKDVKISTINEKNLEEQVYEAYEEGVSSLEKGDALFAAKKFNEAEILFPQSVWAPRSSLMAAYSYYSQDYYQNSTDELIRFLKIYPNHIRTDYARYLLAINYYEQIINEKKDLGPILEAKKNFTIVKENFPNSDFSLDAEYKLNLIEEILASKEMYLAKYYSKQEK